MFKKALFSVLYITLFLPFTNVAAADSVAIAAEVSDKKVVIDYQYFQLDPDIITNYIKPGKRIGYIRVTIELMVKSASDYAIVEMHDPLIRDRIISILGEQDEGEIKSITEREIIRLRSLNEINDVLFAVTGQKPVADLLFTKYLYQ